MLLGVDDMFNRKNTQKIATVIILVVIVAMLVTTVLPAMM